MKITPQILSGLKENVVSKKRQFDNLFLKLRRVKPKILSSIFHKLHLEAFNEINCLECANCCKSISPRIFESDISRMAKEISLSISEFKNKYIIVDEDGDNIFNHTPCPFLSDDNYCIIYKSRPKACCEYPHTDQKKIYQILAISRCNLSICPALSYIIQKIEKSQFR